MSLLLPIFPKFSGRPSPEIRASLEKKLYFWDPRWKGYQPCEFHLIWKNLKIWSFFTIVFAVKHKTEQ